jgi:acyl dehydratase
MGRVAAPGVILGERVGPFHGDLDPDFARRFAAATRDPSSRVQAREVAPSVALVARIWEAQSAGRSALVSPELQRSAKGGVHGEHDIVLHRPIVLGESLRIWVEGVGARPAGRHASVTLRYLAIDASDDVVAEQWWTTVLLGTSCDQLGDLPPDHAFPEEARPHQVGTYTIEVDDDMARRYAATSGDWSPHHFEVAAARQSGSERLFLHGLCTMALCAQGIVSLVADGDPDRIRRIGVRFASPTFVGEQLHVHLYDAGTLGYAFEAECAGNTVISHGRVQLR